MCVNQMLFSSLQKRLDLIVRMNVQLGINFTFLLDILPGLKVLGGWLKATQWERRNLVYGFHLMLSENNLPSIAI